MQLDLTPQGSQSLAALTIMMISAITATGANKLGLLQRQWGLNSHKKPS
jgi:hypothetical protein